ncbi:unnamed protein product [Adineta steineri]|uniref:DNA polymerase epsilon subunit B N-terminal domain-containing protein n=1 Tax=Adineta steineri TaxID=433720 RepID=A0A820I4X9_9BILA|nr:unnamed protein product [Adineta steineri]
MSSDSSVKSNVLAAFRLRGLDLKFDASQFLVELASTVPSASLTSWLDQLIDLLTKRNLSSSIVEKNTFN